MHTIQRPTFWQLRTRRLEFGARPLLMGILNVTPDSFSDGGQFLSTNAAIEQGIRLADEGADLLDIGGESSRPNADPVDEATELARVIPVVESLAKSLSIPLSVDTTKASVARAALAAGAEIINDITALTGDPRMLSVASQTQAAVVLMHMQGTPRTMQRDPQYQDVVAEVLAYLRQRIDEAVAAGIERARIAVDPGIGFGKLAEHSLTLIDQCQQFHALGQPLLVGHSRKSFLSQVSGDSNQARLAGTVAVGQLLAQKNVQILRVHDVAAVRAALDASLG